MEQTAVPLPRGTNPHRQHSEGFPREGFPSSSQGGCTGALTSPPLPPARPRPAHVPSSGDTLETAQHLTGWWPGAAPAPGCAPCIPGAAPASARGLQQGKAALDPSGFATRALSMGGCAHSTWGLHSHALPAFPLGFVLLFNQPNSLLGASTPAIEAGGSGEGGGCLAPMSTGCPGAALEFDGRSCRLYCSSRVWFAL